MKQLGNLAIVCAQRNNVLLQILNGKVTVYIGEGTERSVMHTEWTDDAKISEMVRELNFGQYAERKDDAA